MSEGYDCVLVDARRTAWREVGAGRPLVLIHGVGLNADLWQPQIDTLSKSCRVIVYDTLGHGRSALPPAPARLTDYVAQLGGLLDHIGVASATLVGHSMGAMIATAFAIEYPARVTALVAMNAVYERAAEQRESAVRRADLLDRDGPAANVDTTIARWLGDPLDSATASTAETLRGWLNAANATGYARAYRVFALGDREFAGRLGRLTMPALFVTGEFDPHSTPAMTHCMAAETPRGEAVILAGERHMAAFVSPAEVNAVLNDFLTRHDLRGVTADRQPA